MSVLESPDNLYEKIHSHAAWESRVYGSTHLFCFPFLMGLPTFGRRHDNEDDVPFMFKKELP